MFGALALAVRLSGSVVLVRERRLGARGREFDLLRFRCEPVAPPGPRALGGPQLTGAGRLLRRTGMEDLPQLLNVLKGELSMVGPRPERPEILKILGVDLELRTSMRPGITGPAQVAALAGGPDVGARVAADEDYVRNWSLWVDLRVIARTVRAMVRP